MDSIKYLLSAIIKLSIVLFMGAFVLWLVGYLYPNAKPSNVFNWSIFEHDWLPAPRNMVKDPVGPGKDGTYGTVYQHGEPFNGYATQPTQYVTYSPSGQQPGSTQRSYPGTASSYSERMQYVRNMNLYEGSALSYGETIYGESRDFMFKNGIFQIVIADRTGKAIASMPAMNLGVWSIPGWIRWKAVVPVRLPKNIDCLLVFISSDGRVVATFPVRCE